MNRKQLFKDVIILFLTAAESGKDKGGLTTQEVGKLVTDFEVKLSQYESEKQQELVKKLYHIDTPEFEEAHRSLQFNEEDYYKKGFNEGLDKAIEKVRGKS